MNANAVNLGEETILLRLGVYGISSEERKGILDDFFNILTMRVGKRMADMIPNEDLNRLPDAGLPEGQVRAQYVQAMDIYIPDRREIVDEELDTLFADFVSVYNKMHSALEIGFEVNNE